MKSLSNINFKCTRIGDGSLDNILNNVFDIKDIVRCKEADQATRYLMYHLFEGDSFIVIGEDAKHALSALLSSIDMRKNIMLCDANNMLRRFQDTFDLQIVDGLSDQEQLEQAINNNKIIGQTLATTTFKTIDELMAAITEIRDIVTEDIIKFAKHIIVIDKDSDGAVFIKDVYKTNQNVETCRIVFEGSINKKRECITLSSQENTVWFE